MARKRLDRADGRALGRHSRRAAMNSAALFERLAAAYQTAGSASAWAAQHGFAPSYLADVQAQRRPPSARLLDALGLEWRIAPRER